MANRRIAYTDRDFEALRQDLIDYTQQYYPELIQNFNDASVFSVLMDLNAAIGDNLHFHIDRSIQETVLQFAQQRSSIFNIARTYGLKVPGFRPSVALVDISITVPAFGDSEDVRYLGILRAGAQFNGGGTTFETVYDIDFSTQFNREGFVNRTKIPQFSDNNSAPTSYVITKREIVVNGSTQVFKKVITPAEVTPFYSFFLPEKNVLGVTSIIQKDGTNYQSTPSFSEFQSSPNKWYEVDALVENTVFIEDPTKPVDDAGVKVGKYIKTDNRFITEYTPEGFLRIQFGNGTVTPEEQLNQFTTTGVPLTLQNYQNNIGLGLTVKANTTVINNNVTQSIRVTNVTAAIGGANQPSLNEVRNMVTYNFAAQKRAVTINDYKSLIDTMPGQYGAPAKVSITEFNNKILVKILSFDAQGALTQIVSNNLKTNLATYLSKYRMINDYISIEVAKVIDLEFEFFVVLTAAGSQSQVITQIINNVTNYMAPSTRELGENVNVSEIRQLVQSIEGINSLTEIRVYNRVGGQYSSSETSQRYIDNTTKQIELIDDTIFAEPDQIYQIRFPNKDIKVRVKNLTSVDFM